MLDHAPVILKVGLQEDEGEDLTQDQSINSTERKVTVVQKIREVQNPSLIVKD